MPQEEMSPEEWARQEKGRDSWSGDAHQAEVNRGTRRERERESGQGTRSCEASRETTDAEGR